MNFFADASPLILAGLFILLGAAALQDWVSGRISWWFAAGIALLCLGWATNEGELNALVTNSLVALGALLLTVVLFSIGAMGGGAAKLFSATAFAAGLGGILAFAAGTFIAGGLIALVALGWKRLGGRKGEARVPFGLAILAGAVTAQLY
ncbi:prepilin peptidase [Sphingomicrobium lutaoense]|uniref:Prepilin peptidase CpaA n=1 Tax=Sphingomicrobium lutaoense TaxID=515949 RepID=A0A839Z4B0_9SPHN|nr:prepilin peptidase [Sphingomicrobium lutaoense]MBB3764683.1 prepilin peptidase CpaA [Sphingomicrobium lutaoense]